MKIIICDASPLIFLAKLNQLGLINQVLEGKIHVLQCVVDVVCSEKASPLESLYLQEFLQEVEIVDFKLPENQPKLSSLSQSDQSTLLWAIENHADWIIADERLLRRVATENGIPVVGFLGIILVAAKRKIVSRKEALQAVNNAVSSHGCQISIALYQRILDELNSL